MTFNVAHVEGGTGAGRKRPLRDKPKPWTHHCKRELTEDEVAEQEARLEFVGRWIRYPRTLPGYLSRCPVCKQERP